MGFWEFLFTADSGKNFPMVLLSMAVFLVITMFLSFLEHRFRMKWLWIALHAILVTVASLIFMALGAGLSEMLIFLLVFLLIRLWFVFFEGRDKV